jgi:hypothetical protein
MIMLQVSTDSLNIATSVIKSGHSFWFYFEIVLIICVIIYQLIHSGKVFFSVEELKGIFKNPMFIKNGFIEKANLNKEQKSVDDIIFPEKGQKYKEYNNKEEYSKISIAHTDGKGIISQICNDINNYLIHNYGADVNFANIKDIIDRQIEVKDDEISQSITTPLYLGLAATMIGIIFGLLAMPDLSAGGFSEGISALIKGVRWAMSASLIGLACTSYLSVIKYKNANKTLLEGKNEQISYLQAKLLPAIIDANQTGLQGLKTQIEQFSRDAFKISAELKETSLNNQYSLITTNEIIHAQQEIFNKIERIDILNVIRVNEVLFEKLEKSIYAFKQFADYIELMGQISTQLKDFASRTSNIDSITRHIESSLSDNKKLIEFLSIHFNKIENAGNAALNAVDVADSHFSDAIERLSLNTESTLENLFKSITESSSKFAEAIDSINNEIQSRTEKINQNAVDQESKITEIYNIIGDKLNEIVANHIESLETAFTNTIPQFNQLDKLDKLDELSLIRETMDSNLRNVPVSFSKSLNELQENIGRHFDNLYRSTNSANHLTTKPTKKSGNKDKKVPEIKDSENQVKQDQPLGLFNFIKKLLLIKS